MMIPETNNSSALLRFIRDKNLLLNKSDFVDNGVAIEKIYKSPKIYVDLFNSLKSFYKVLTITGGRGSTKTQSTATFLLQQSEKKENRNKIILCGREYLASIKDSSYALLVGLINLPKHNSLKDRFIITNTEIISKKTGCKFIFKGLGDYIEGSAKANSNQAKHKSLTNIKYVWIDEAQTITENTLNNLLPTARPLRATFYDARDEESLEFTDESKFIFTLNPLDKETDPAIAHFKHWNNAKQVHINIFDLPKKYQLPELLKSAENDKKHNPLYNHIWLGESKLNLDGCLFAYDKFNIVDDFKNIKEYERVVIGVDPAITNKGNSDETGIVVVGYANKSYYVIEDLSGRYKPEEWGRVVTSAYVKYNCNVVVAESNQGGDLVKNNILNNAVSGGRGLNVESFYSKYAKHVRAENPAMEHNLGRVVYGRNCSELVNQLRYFTYAGYVGRAKSPDRADAFVFAMLYLIDLLPDNVENAEDLVFCVG